MSTLSSRGSELSSLRIPLRRPDWGSLRVAGVGRSPAQREALYGTTRDRRQVFFDQFSSKGAKGFTILFSRLELLPLGAGKHTAHLSDHWTDEEDWHQKLPNTRTRFREKVGAIDVARRPPAVAKAHPQWANNERPVNPAVARLRSMTTAFTPWDAGRRPSS